MSAREVNAMATRKPKPKPKTRRRPDAAPVVIDPYKRLMVALALAPAFAEAYFDETKLPWKNADDMADSLLWMADAIVRKLGR